MKKLPYREGDWFGVPIGGGFAVGLVARCHRRGKTLFGYFFGPKRAKLPAVDELGALAPGDAIFVARFGDLGLINGEWPVIGTSKDWNRAKWPMPPFGRIDVVDSNVGYLTFYSEDDPGDALEFYTCDPAEIARFSEDGGWGYGAVEHELKALCK